MKTLLFGCGTRDFTASAGILALRLGFGLMMLVGHGLPKLRNFQTILDKGFYTPDFFPLNWMSTPVSLGAAMAAEFFGAVLIILGLATRWAALAVGFTMVVAAFAVHGEAPWFLGPGVTYAKEPALIYLAAMITLILAGPGRFSLDALLDKPRKGRMKIALGGIS